MTANLLPLFLGIGLVTSWLGTILIIMYYRDKKTPKISYYSIIVDMSELYKSRLEEIK